MTAPAPVAPAPAPAAAPAPAGGPSAWFAGHKKEAAIGGSIAAVLAFALYQRRHAGAASNVAAAAATTDPTGTGTLDTAGLSGTPDGSTDYASQLAALNDEVAQMLQQNETTPTTPTAPTTPTPIQNRGAAIYTIKKGDTLDKIAAQVFGEADAGGVNAIKAANPILWTFYQGAALDFFAGHTIKIPAYYPAKPTTPAPPKKTPTPAKPGTGGGSAPTYYTIRYGDTLTSIAARFRTSVSKLAALNHISNPNLIYAGHQIRVS